MVKIKTILKNENIIFHISWFLLLFDFFLFIEYQKLPTQKHVEKLIDFEIWVNFILTQLNCEEK